LFNDLAGHVELRHLRYFVAVAKELNFTRAVARFHTAQPSLSQQIRQLEAAAGVALLDRSRRHLASTNAGRTCLLCLSCSCPVPRTQNALKRFLLILRDLIFDSRVDDGMPSFNAAPEGPDTRPLVTASTAPMMSRSSIAVRLKG
jgi:hypothetical protein